MAPQALSNAELLALIIGSGPRGSTAIEVGGRLLDLVSSNLDSLGRIPTEAYMENCGSWNGQSGAIIGRARIGTKKTPSPLNDLNPQLLFVLRRMSTGDLFSD